MERVLSVRRTLRCFLWFAEAAIIGIGVFVSYQIGMESKGAVIWACAPLMIVSLMETLRVPLASWTAHLKPVAMVGGVMVMAAISVLTFESMSLGFERFMHQRVLDVLNARDVLDAAKQKTVDAEAAAKAHDADIAKQTEEVAQRRTHVADLTANKPEVQAVPNATISCQTWRKDKHGRPYKAWTTCPNPQAGKVIDGNTAILANRDKEIVEARESLAEAETALAALQLADGAGKALAAAKTEQLAAQKAVFAAMVNSTMYRTAATWWGVPTKDITDEQFERFKRIAVGAVAGATAVATMLIAFVSQATPRGQKPGKVSRAIRAYYARKRKPLVRIKTIEVPVGERVVEKRVDVPGPERIVVKHIHVPVDMGTGRIVNADGSLGEPVGLRTVQGGKQ